MACSLCILVVALPLAVPVAAVVLRVAVWLANRVLGRPTADGDYGYEVDDYILPPVRATAVPPPSFAKAAGLTALTTLGTVAVGFAVALAVEKARGVGANDRLVWFACPTAAAALLIQTGLLTLLLPTTFPRACLVGAFVVLLGLPVAAATGWLAILGLDAVAPNMGR